MTLQKWARGPPTKKPEISLGSQLSGISQTDHCSSGCAGNTIKQTHAMSFGMAGGSMSSLHDTPWFTQGPTPLSAYRPAPIPQPSLPVVPQPPVAEMVQQLDLDRALAIGMQLTTEQQAMLCQAALLYLIQASGLDARQLPRGIVEGMVRAGVLIETPSGYPITPLGMQVLVGITLRLALGLQGGR